MSQYMQAQSNEMGLGKDHFESPANARDETSPSCHAGRCGFVLAVNRNDVRKRSDI